MVGLIVLVAYSIHPATPKVLPANDSGFLAQQDHMNIAYAKGFKPGDNVTTIFSWERGTHSLVVIGNDGIASEAYNTTALNPAGPNVVSFVDQVPGNVIKVVNIRVG